MTPTARKVLLAAATAAVALSCGKEPPPPERAGLGGGIAARVGNEAVRVETLRRIVDARGVTAERARELAVSDALFAAHAREVLGPIRTRAAERGVLARAVLEALSAEARGRGEPTDAEVEEATQERFWELDRPVLRRTTHAVVVSRDGGAEAKALAERIASAASSSTDTGQFRRAVESVPKGKLEVRIEDLQPVALDGRAVDPGSPPPPGAPIGRYSIAYAAGAFAVPEVGRAGQVVRTEFGYHVIFLVGVVPEHRVPLEERRRLLEQAILLRRASVLTDQVVERVQATAPVEIERAALDLMQEVGARQ